jgi:hypothetical protein
MIDFHLLILKKKLKNPSANFDEACLCDLIESVEES